MNLVYKCDPENQERLGCVHLAVMKLSNQSCYHRTKYGYCARFNDRQIKDVVDKLGQLEERGVPMFTTVYSNRTEHCIELGCSDGKK